MSNYKRGYDKRRGSFCKLCKYGKRLGNSKVSKTNNKIKLEARIKYEFEEWGQNSS